MRVSSPTDSVTNSATKSNNEENHRNPVVENVVQDIRSRNHGMNTDTKLVQCSVCAGWYKLRGLLIHQAKKGCRKQLSGSQRNKNKSEATSTQDTNHSDASGRVTLKTTRRGIGAQNMEAMEKVTKETKRKRMSGETCKEEENVVAKGRARKLKSSEERTDIRNWFKKNEVVDKVNIQRIKIKYEVNGQEKEESVVELIDLTEETTQAEPNDVRTEGSGIELVDLTEESSPAELIEVRSNIRQEKVEKKVSIQRGHVDDILNKRLDLRRWDFQTLNAKVYINDRIIDEYLRLIQERNEVDLSLPEVFAGRTHRYTMMEVHGLRYALNLYDDDLRSKELILFPIHNDQLFHWSLVAVETSSKTVNYFDSLPRQRIHSRAPRTVKKYMEMHYEDRGEKVSFRIKRRVDAPLQENGYDCGVFLCQYAERVAKRCPLNFSQNDLDLACARERMTQELLGGRINPEWRMVNWVKEVERNQKNNKEYKEGKRKENACRVEKQHQSKKQEDKGKAVAKKSASDLKEGPKEISNGNSEREVKRKGRINWPKANSAEWIKFDEDVTNILKNIHSSHENKAETHPSIIYAVGKDRFGVKEGKQKSQPAGPSKRQKKCIKLREEIKKLKVTYKNAPEEEKEAINQLQQEKLKKLRLKKRAESIKQNRKKLSRNCSEFLSQPFDFSRKIIAPKPRGEMKSSKAEVENQLHKAHSDQSKDKEREISDDLHEYEEPSVEFNNSPPSRVEFNKRLRKTRSKSTPGPNGVPYLVYKRCTGLASQLFYYTRGMWKKNVISESWRKAEGIFIPKEDGATSVEKFRTISLLNVEGKLYFALRADRLVTYTLANKYIDTSIQKGGVPAVSGCMEHTAVLSQLIREAKAEKKGLVVVWLDIANAYGSIPHGLIQLALKRAHVPEDFCKLVESYYANMNIRFTTKNFTTEWQRVEKGIITGCTLSVILFALSMTMLVMSVKDETKGPKTSSGQNQVNTSLFMDDIATRTENLVQTKYLLDKLVGKLKWAGLSIKPEKSRSLVIIGGKVSNKTPSIEGVPITSITEKPIKYLGKLYNKTLNEQEQAKEVLSELKQGLKKIEKTMIPGRYKAWMFQHMLLPRMMWPLTIYNIPESKVEEMQIRITGHLKRWLGLPKSLSAACMYTRSGRLQLPYSELSEEVKAAKARVYTTFEESEDPCVRGAKLQVDGGRKADTPGRVKDAKLRLRMREIGGIPNRGKEGLGLNPRKYYGSSTKEERRTMVVDTVRETEEDMRRVKMISLAKQGAHTRWEVPEKRLSHREILSTSETSLKFLVKAVYDLLPTPSNKNIWFGSEETCKLCGGNGTLTHILSGCEVALGQGRYTWRHNQVLRQIALCVDAKRINHNNHFRRVEKKIQFVKAGDKRTPTPIRLSDSYLDGANDWELKTDLDGNLKFPRQIADTNLRPDMFLLSESTKKIGLIELTVPSEERVEVSGEIKKARYEPLQELGKVKGWNVHLWAVEVGFRGFPAASMASFLKDLGIAGGERNRHLKKIGEEAMISSRRIWNWSHFTQWGNENRRYK